MIGSAGVLAAVLAVAGYTSGDRQDPAGGAPGSTANPAAPAQPLPVELVATDKVPPSGPDAKRAAKQAAPGLERFLDR